MNSDRTSVKYFIVATIVLISFLPTINLLKVPRETNYKNLFNTDLIERYINYTFYKLFDISLEPDKVIIGKDNFLFLGNKYNNVLSKSRGLYRVDYQQLTNWMDKLKKLQEWYEAQGIRFVFAIAPNKHVVYKDKLPQWCSFNEMTVADEVIQYSKERSINLVYLRDALQQKRQTNKASLYIKTDTHWNLLGASVGYESTMQYINQRFHLDYKMPQYRLSYHKRKAGEGGDLSGFLKITSLIPEHIDADVWVKFDTEYSICRGDINDETSELNNCQVKNNTPFSILEKPQYTINKESLNKVNALILCDSFGTANSQFYSATFNKIWKFHYGKMSGNKLSRFVKKYKPDIVIYQVIERALLNENIVDDLSDNSL